MANWQDENGNYTRVANGILEALAKTPLLGAEIAVCLFVIRKTYGYGKTSDEISLTQFQEGIQRSRPTVVKALKNLQLVKILELVKSGNSKLSSNNWAFNKNFSEWKLVKTPELVKSRDTTSKVNASELVKVSLHTKERTKENTKEILPSGGEIASLPPRKTNRRLEIFLETYRAHYGRDYLVTNFSEHGGAAKRTEKLIPDETVYRRAVRAYLAAIDKRIVEANHPFLWFVRELNRWVSHEEKPNLFSGFEGKDYHAGTF